MEEMYYDLMRLAYEISRDESGDSWGVGLGISPYYMNLIRCRFPSIDNKQIYIMGVKVVELPEAEEGKIIQWRAGEKIPNHKCLNAARAILPNNSRVEIRLPYTGGGYRGVDGECVFCQGVKNWHLALRLAKERFHNHEWNGDVENGTD